MFEPGTEFESSFLNQYCLNTFNKKKKEDGMQSIHRVLIQFKKN